jgi:hypothetical protein
LFGVLTKQKIYISTKIVRVPSLFESQHREKGAFIAQVICILSNCKISFAVFLRLMRHCLLFWFSLLCFYEASAQTEKLLIPYRKGNLWGFADEKREIVIQPQFEETQFFLRDLAKVKQNEKWGLADLSGKLFLPCAYNIVYGASTKGRVVVCQGGDKNGHGGRWGFTDKYIGDAIPLQYDLIRECGANGLVGVSNDNLWGAVNAQNKIIVPIIYEVEHIENHAFTDKNILEASAQFLPDFEDGYLKLNFINQLARIRKKGAWGYVNQFGNEVIPPVYDFVGEFSENVVCAVKSTVENGEISRKSGFLNAFHEIIIPFEYEVREESYRKTQFSERLVALSKQGKYGYLNAENEVIIPFQYTQAHPFSEGLALVTEEMQTVNPTWQVIDKKGKTVFKIPAGFQVLDFQFQAGFIRVRKEGKENCLDGKGNLLSALWYDSFDNFRQDLAKVVLRGKTGYIDTQGKLKIPCEYDNENGHLAAERLKDYIKLRKNGQWGVVNLKNQVIIPFVYQDLLLPFSIRNDQLFSSGLLAVKQGGLWGYLAEKNTLVIPYQYEKVQPFDITGYAKVWLNGKIGYINAKGERFWGE